MERLFLNTTTLIRWKVLKSCILVSWQRKLSTKCIINQEGSFFKFSQFLHVSGENYLTIESNNIEDGFAHDFEKYENRIVYMNGLPVNGDLTQPLNPGIQNAQLLKYNE